MSTPLSFCDISARYGQMPAPQKSIEEFVSTTRAMAAMGI